MIYCDSPTLDFGPAPPQECFPEQNNPRSAWTRLIANGVELSNSIEYTDWNTDPVLPIVCETCWQAGCIRAGIARIVRLPGQLLWTRPRCEDIDEFWRDGADSSFIREAVLVPQAARDELSARFPQIRAAEQYPRATRTDVARLWLGEMPEAIRVAELGQIEDLTWTTLLASDPLELEPAKDVIRELCAWLTAAPNEPVTNRISRVAENPGRVNTLYFDGPRLTEWAAFTVDGPLGFTFGPDFVLPAD